MELLSLRLQFAALKRAFVFLECVLMTITILAMYLLAVPWPVLEATVAFAILRVITEGLNYFELLERLQLRDTWRLWPL